MSVTLSASFAFELEHAADALLQFEAASLADQRIVSSRTSISSTRSVARVAAQDDIGERIWIHAEGKVEVEYAARIALERQVAPVEDFAAIAPHRLPGSAVKFLLDSRYCHVSQFIAFTDTQFAGTAGGARVAAIRDWVHAHVAYAPGASHQGTSATDTFHAGEGICRDFAHLFVTLARASSIPTRYVACYAPGVTPQDFHAVAQVFLADPTNPDEGAWHLVDATGMADLSQAVIIGVGRDAVDVSYLTSFGPMRFLGNSVTVEVEAHSRTQPTAPRQEPADELEGQT